MIYNLHIFTRNGDCIYYHEWNRTKEQTISQEEVCVAVPHLWCFRIVNGICQKLRTSTSSAAGVQAHVRHDLFHQIFCKKVSAKAQVSAPDRVFTEKLTNNLATLVSVQRLLFPIVRSRLLANHIFHGTARRLSGFTKPISTSCISMRRRQG